MRSKMAIVALAGVAASVFVPRVAAAGDVAATAILSGKGLPKACQAGQQDPSSLHASVLESTLFDAPKDRAKLLLVCDAKPIAVYFYDYETAEAAATAAAFIGARLWGEPAPTGEHRDEVLLRDGIVVVLSPEPGILAAVLVKRGFRVYRGGPPEEDVTDLGAPPLTQMRARLDCKKHARYCQALDEFGRGAPATQTPDVRALAGSSLRVEASAGPNTSVEEASYLVLGKTGAKYGTVRPETREEEEQVASFLSFVRAGKSVPPAHPIMAYVQSLTKSELRATRRVGKSLRFQAANQVFVRQSGKLVIAVEHDGPTGVFFVGVFRTP